MKIRCAQDIPGLACSCKGVVSYMELCPALAWTFFKCTFVFDDRNDWSELAWVLAKLKKKTGQAFQVI